MTLRAQAAASSPRARGVGNDQGMPITYDAVKALSADLYDWSLRAVPADTKDGLRRALETETQDGARKVWESFALQLGGMGGIEAIAQSR